MAVDNHDFPLLAQRTRRKCASASGGQEHRVVVSTLSDRQRPEGDTTGQSGLSPHLSTPKRIGEHSGLMTHLAFEQARRILTGNCQGKNL